MAVRTVTSPPVRIALVREMDSLISCFTCSGTAGLARQRSLVWPGREQCVQLALPLEGAALEFLAVVALLPLVEEALLLRVCPLDPALDVVARPWVPVVGRPLVSILPAAICCLRYSGSL